MVKELREFFLWARFLCREAVTRAVHGLEYLTFRRRLKTRGSVSRSGFAAVVRGKRKIASFKKGVLFSFVGQVVERSCCKIEVW